MEMTEAPPPPSHSGANYRDNNDRDHGSGEGSLPFSFLGTKTRADDDDDTRGDPSSQGSSLLLPTDPDGLKDPKKALELGAEATKLHVDLADVLP